MKIATLTTYIFIINSHKKTHLIVKTSFDKNAITLLYKTEWGGERYRTRKKNTHKALIHTWDAKEKEWEKMGVE